jgi:hypothetical protein
MTTAHFVIPMKIGIPDEVPTSVGTTAPLTFDDHAEDPEAHVFRITHHAASNPALAAKLFVRFEYRVLQMLWPRDERRCAERS